MPPVIRVALIGDFNPGVVAHQAIPRALARAAAVANTTVDGCWIATDRIESAPVTLLDSFDAIWCVPASPYRSTNGALTAIRYARENDVPFLGTCGGFQHAILEFARNVAGISDATHAELDPAAENPLLAPLACALVEVTGRIRIEPQSLLHDCYDADMIEEGYHCSYGVNEEYRAALTDAGMTFTAFGEDGTVRGFELRQCSFFVGVLFQPERAALRGEISPPVCGFVNAAMNANKKSRAEIVS